MSEILNNIKIQMRHQFSILYKQVKTANLPQDEFDVFLNWFWKIRPLLEIDGDKNGESTELVKKEDTDTE